MASVIPTERFSGGAGPPEERPAGDGAVIVRLGRRTQSHHALPRPARRAVGACRSGRSGRGIPLR